MPDDNDTFGVDEVVLRRVRAACAALRTGALGELGDVMSDLVLNFTLSTSAALNSGMRAGFAVVGSSGFKAGFLLI